MFILIVMRLDLLPVILSVTDKKMLGGVTLGDNVDFTLLYKDGTEKISSIKKTQ